MPPEPQDTPDPAEPPDYEALALGERAARALLVDGYSRMLRAMARRSVRNRQNWHAIRDGYRNIHVAQFARLASAVGLPGAGVDDIEAAIQRLRAERAAGLNAAMRAQPSAEPYLELIRLRAEVARLRAENDDLRRLCADELAREGQEMGLDTGTDNRDGGAHEPVTAGMLRGLASDLDRVVTSRKSKRQRVQAIQEVAADLRSLADLAPAPASPVPPAPDEARDEDDDCDLIEAVHQLQDEQADRFNCDPPGTAAAARKRIAEFNARDPFGPEEERPADCGFCTVQGKWFHINSSCGEHGDL